MIFWAELLDAGHGADHLAPFAGFMIGSIDDADRQLGILAILFDRRRHLASRRPSATDNRGELKYRFVGLTLGIAELTLKIHVDRDRLQPWPQALSSVHQSPAMRRRFRSV